MEALKGLKNNGHMVSLRTKLLVSFGGLFAVVLIIIEMISLYGVPFTPYAGRYQIQRAGVYNSLSAQADNKKTLLQLWLTERRDDVHVLAQDDSFRQAMVRINAILPDRHPSNITTDAFKKILAGSRDWSWLMQRLAAIREVYGNVIIDVVSAKNGMVVASSDDGHLGDDRFEEEDYNITKNPLYEEVIRTTIDGAGHSILRISREMHGFNRQNDNISAVITFSINLDEIIRPMVNTGLPFARTGEVMLVNKENQPLTSLRYPYADGSSVKPLVDRLQMQPASLAVSGGEGVVSSKDYRGVQVLAAYRHLRLSSDVVWGMVVKVDQNEAFEEIYRTNYLVTFLGVIGSIMVMLVSSILSKIMTRPITLLHQASEKVRNGDLTVRADVVSNDEVGVLAASFNDMVAEMQGAHQNLEILVARRTEELNEASDRVSLVLNSAAEGIYGLDTKGLCTFVNKTALQMLGYGSEEELVGKNIHDLIHHLRKDGSVYPAEDCPIFSCFLAGANVHCDRDIFCRSDGSSFPVEYWGHPIRGRDGRIIGAVSSFFDISERVEAQSAVRHSEEKYRRLHESMRDACANVDMNGTIIESNQAFQAILGYSPDELRTLNYLDITNEKWHEMEARIIAEQVLARGYSDVYEKEYIRKDRTIIPVEIRTFLLDDEAGTPMGMWAIVRDISERKKAEALLKQSEKRFRDLFDNSPDPCWLIEDNLFVDCNHAAVQILGYPDRRTLCSMHPSVLSPEYQPDGRTSFGKAEEMMARAHDLCVHRFEWLHKKLNGDCFPVEVTLARLELEGKHLLYCIWRDISDRKKAQEVLETERTRLRILLKTIPALVWLKDPEGVFLACNEQFERLFNAKEADIIGKTDYDFVVRDLADSFRANDKKAAAAGGPTVNEEWVTYADDGHRELLETIKTPVIDSEGKFIGVMGVARNITEQRRIEEELNNERLRFANLVDTVEGIVWELDIETFTFTYVSKQAERLLGYPLQEWREPGFWVEHLHPDDKAWVYEFCVKSTEARRDHAIEYRFIAKDGRSVWIHDLVTVVVEGGAPRWLRGIMVDTTNRKMEEIEKQKLEAHLRQAQKMEAIGRLAGGIAHDFNNKLTVILGYAEIARDIGSQGEKYREYLNQIIKAAVLSQDITRQLLAFSRQEVIAPKPVNLNVLIVEAEKSLGRLIGEDITLTFRPDNSLWTVELDPFQFDQILMNLAVNARDAMPHGGSLSITTTNEHVDDLFCHYHIDAKPGDYVVMTVCDSGMGMDNETIKHIFEPFFTTKDVGRGTGLGLATVFGIVAQNNGFINVVSEIGHGTTFAVYLPRSIEDSGEKQAGVVVPVVGRGAILVVEDEEAVLEMVTQMLESIGYTVYPQKGASEAIEFMKVGERKVDLILTDVIMPVMSGKEMVERIWQLHPGTKVLYMSGYTSDVIALKGVLEEGTCLIHKPFDKKILSESIRTVLRGEG